MSEMPKTIHELENYINLKMQSHLVNSLDILVFFLQAGAIAVTLVVVFIGVFEFLYVRRDANKIKKNLNENIESKTQEMFDKMEKNITHQGYKIDRIILEKTQSLKESIKEQAEQLGSKIRENSYEITEKNLRTEKNIDLMKSDLRKWVIDRFENEILGEVQNRTERYETNLNKNLHKTAVVKKAYVLWLQSTLEDNHTFDYVKYLHFENYLDSLVIGSERDASDALSILRRTYISNGRVQGDLKWRFYLMELLESLVSSKMFKGVNLRNAQSLIEELKTDFI